MKEFRSINIGGKLMTFDIPKVMAIVNVTPDSFVPGSRTMGGQDIERRISEITSQGADIIDIGGYSTRPGAAEVSPEEEYTRLARGLELIRKVVPQSVVSVDTFRADVARKCVEEWGVSIINDISGGDLDEDMAETVAELGVAYVAMHTRGTPATMQQMTTYDNVTAEVLEDLAAKLSRLRLLGVNDVIIDPGFGFAKTVSQNYQLLRELEIFKALGVPVLAGLSRKSMIWRPLGISPEDAADGTTALGMVALLNGADILRVHDVRPAVETVKLYKLLCGDAAEV
ncbi:MAG: dihydropteroate synthase [Prevotella sp.]|nr:dihydropteroate synthase [Bacteroides sp.]MCM1367076.1 dihydropteroate synthase [Prevotella sp.]MCM1437542.1 dihydropteroate synthase [Prevotella sp.]